MGVAVDVRYEPEKEASQLGYEEGHGRKARRKRGWTDELETTFVQSALLSKETSLQEGERSGRTRKVRSNSSSVENLLFRGVRGERLTRRKER